MKHNDIIKKTILLGSLALAGAAFTGCNGGGTTGQIYSDPTPAVDGLALTKSEIKNNLNLYRDTDFRQINDDLGRLFMLDRPSRLTPRPIAY